MTAAVNASGTRTDAILKVGSTIARWTVVDGVVTTEIHNGESNSYERVAGGGGGHH